jgi:hypothetical protein
MGDNKSQKRNTEMIKVFRNKLMEHISNYNAQYSKYPGKVFKQGEWWFIWNHRSNHKVIEQEIQGYGNGV